MDYPEGVAPILENMRKKCAEQFGVTLVGNRLTLRCYHEGNLVSVHMIIENVEDGQDPQEEEDQ